MRTEYEKGEYGWIVWGYDSLAKIYLGCISRTNNFQTWEVFGFDDLSLFEWLGSPNDGQILIRLINYRADSGRPTLKHFTSP